MSAAVEVVVRHLVMRSPEAHRPSGRRADGIVVRCETDATRGAVARECYHRVGARWSWTDRAHWEAEEWEALLRKAIVTSIIAAVIVAAFTYLMRSGMLTLDMMPGMKEPPQPSAR